MLQATCRPNAARAHVSAVRAAAIFANATPRFADCSGGGGATSGANRAPRSVRSRFPRAPAGVAEGIEQRELLGARPSPAGEAEQAGNHEQAGAGLGNHREAKPEVGIPGGCAAGT